jgi:hypothetical protein
VGIFILILCNSLLLVTYLTTINENEIKLEGRDYDFLPKTKIDFTSILLLILIFLLSPKIFIIF